MMEGKDVIEKECDGVEPCQKACNDATVTKRYVKNIVGMRSTRSGRSHTYEGIFVSHVGSAYSIVSLE